MGQWDMVGTAVQVVTVQGMVQAVAMVEVMQAVVVTAGTVAVAAATDGTTLMGGARFL